MKKNTNEANSAVTLGNIIKTEAGMPILEVLLNEECTGYLSPFRGYCFQVSMTSSGQWDMGSSPVLGLKNILEATVPGVIGSGYQSNLTWDGEAQACLLKGLALQALVEYSSRENAVLKLGKSSFEEDNINCVNKYYRDKLEKFIAVVVGYLKEGK